MSAQSLLSYSLSGRCNVTLATFLKNLIEKYCSKSHILNIEEDSTPAQFCVFNLEGTNILMIRCSLCSIHKKEQFYV